MSTSDHFAKKPRQHFDRIKRLFIRQRYKDTKIQRYKDTKIQRCVATNPNQVKYNHALTNQTHRNEVWFVDRELPQIYGTATISAKFSN